MKGSWLLRKAWKIYQKTYTQLYEMYVKRFGNKSTHQPSMYIKKKKIQNLTKCPISNDFLFCILFIQFFKFGT